MTVKVSIRFFGSLKKLAGVEQTSLKTDEDANIEDLLSTLSRKFPGLPLQAEHISFMVNGKIAARNQMLKAGDDIAVFEMFAGG